MIGQYTSCLSNNGQYAPCAHELEWVLFSLLEKMPSEYPVSLIFKAENVTNFEHFTSIDTINW